MNFLLADTFASSLAKLNNAEIDKEARPTRNGPISRPFPKPESGRIVVKVINHLGDEIMKAYRAE